ncbi:hypothetical protein GUITHDRAFT_119390 [Guillardia theta CCMP2712]|uniref:Transglutaminase-like domain-containing protein n=2 Tax=Guillardia theta TaxID=55529 RepID=L1IEE9_GUITC|nr:hypothetical protein GUITHDRAFT_119390 [Guillardia theta CCMP2712]EKX34467.1 hypothetical protein GUITHDRAFT_119390 [Guillardia theta CCMP2712]|eukprot:XP_005821447.1 hypothetical protein GUITHDRAFT_119390 [Guillardia theta CCMP2712]
MPFLLPTSYADSEHEEVQKVAREIGVGVSDDIQAARAVRDWVRRNICYVLDDKDRRASETLRSREGMCTNKANLQVALLRALGVAAGYVLVNVTREAFRVSGVEETLVGQISEPTVHCFCAVYIERYGRFLHFDGTEDLESLEQENLLLEESEDTGETRYKQDFLRGPLGPVQSNIDHLLAWKFPRKIPQELIEEQNSSYRKRRRLQAETQARSFTRHEEASGAASPNGSSDGLAARS